MPEELACPCCGAKGFYAYEDSGAVHYECGSVELHLTEEPILPKGYGQSPKCLASCLKREWAAYRDDVAKRYPPKDGKEFEFSCPHHQEIDKLIARL